MPLRLGVPVVEGGDQSLQQSVRSFDHPSLQVLIDGDQSLIFGGKLAGQALVFLDQPEVLDGLLDAGGEVSN